MLANWVLQAVTGGGAGDISLGDASTGYVGIESVFDNNEELFYTIEDGTDREHGVGTFISSGKRLVRTQILQTLKSGILTDTGATPLTVSTKAKVTVTPSTQGLTTHTKVWKELPMDLTIPPSTSVLVPDYKQFVVNVDAFHFRPTLIESLGVKATYNNDTAVGSTVYPTVRWSPVDNTTGVVRWAITLSVAEIDGTFTDAGVIYLEQAASGVSNQHQLIELDGSSLVAPNPNAILVGRVFRDSAHVNDTYVGEAVLHSVSINYQADKVGTPKRLTDLNNWG